MPEFREETSKTPDVEEKDKFFLVSYNLERGQVGFEPISRTRWWELRDDESVWSTEAKVIPLGIFSSGREARRYLESLRKKGKKKANVTVHVACWHPAPTVVIDPEGATDQNEEIRRAGYEHYPQEEFEPGNWVAIVQRFEDTEEGLLDAHLLAAEIAGKVGEPSYILDRNFTIRLIRRAMERNEQCPRLLVKNLQGEDNQK